MYFDKLGKIIVNNNICDSSEIRLKINRTKALLASKEIPESEVVGLVLPRTENLIITVLALLESNIPFLPVDINSPDKRVNYMFENAQVSRVITEASVHMEVLKPYQRIYLDIGNQFEESNLNYIDNDIAYIIHTSGSTGQPKAVEVTRTGLFNFFDGIADVIDFSPDKVIACLSNYTFDIFFLEGVLALVKGMTVILANEEEQSNPKKIIELIKKHQIKMLQMTPSKIKLIWLYDKELKCLENVEAIMLGGEAFPPQLLKELQTKPNLKIYNLYGPTETTVWCNVSDLTHKNKVDIGRPIKEVKIYLLSDELTQVPLGEYGEICIAGSGLAKGYLNNEEQTKNSFTRLPFEPYERIYRTGDLGSYDEEGNLIFMGRKDNQIKLRGHRIELEEIDANLMKLEEVKLAVTCYDQEAETLNTYYMAEDRIDNKVITNHLALSLPQHMIPNKFYLVDEFKYTTSGKIDRREMLKQKGRDKLESKSVISMKINDRGDDITKKVIEIIKENVKDQSLAITKESNLLDLEINSISYISVIVKLENAFDIIIEDNKLTLAAFQDITEIALYIKHLIQKKDMQELVRQIL